MKTAKMRVIVFQPEQPPAIEEIDNNLETMQKVVGGYIELLTIRRDSTGSLDLCFNEDGIRLQLPLNGTFRGINGTLNEIVGTAFLLRHDLEGESVSVRDEDIATWMKSIHLVDVVISDGYHRRFN